MLNLQELEKQLIGLRGFDVDFYIEQKVRKINTFFKENKLDSCVIGISGGIDSAVVLGLLVEASKIKSSPIKRILPISMPIYGVDGVSNQEIANSDSILIQKYFGFNPYSVNLQMAYIDLINNSMPVLKNREWAEGQMASVLRTPVLYYHASILQTEGYKSIVVGTTNRDEGAYIGFFGKASDGMVDLQPIGDIHKSEVYEIAKRLKIPNRIIEKKPMGDVWDFKVDEEMIGCPYWFLQLYQLAIEYHKTHLFLELNVDDKIKAYDWIINIEKIHQFNFHKYQVGSPAHYIDVYKRKIK